MPRDKYAHEVSWEAVEQVCREWLAGDHQAVRLTITFADGYPERCYLEVTTHPAGGTFLHEDAYTTRHPITPRRSHYLYGQVLRALFDHHTRLESDPWAWPAARRKAARGE